MLLLPSLDLSTMTLLDHEEGSSRGGGLDADPPAFPYQYPVPHPYSPPLHQLPDCEGGGSGGGGGALHSEGDHSFSLCVSNLTIGTSPPCESQNYNPLLDIVMTSCLFGHTGSRSSQSDSSDDQKEEGGQKKSEMTKQEVSSQDRGLDSLSDSGAQRSPLSFSGLHGDEGITPPSPGRRDAFSSIQPEISRKSFRMAMGNPSDLFVNVM